MNPFKRFLATWFPKTTPLETAATELVQAELDKLRAQSLSEWYASDVIYNTRRIERLRNYIQETTK